MTARMWRIGLAAFLLAIGSAPALAATSERIVVDPITGFAIGGMDPVQYFLAGEAQPGVAEHEADWDGAVWRFQNAGNRAAFLAHPQIYAPRFGGHDPVAASRGFAARGDPQLFAIVQDRLYLFHTEDNLRLFVRQHAGVVPQAERNWARLATQLSR